MKRTLLEFLRPLAVVGMIGALAVGLCGVPAQAAPPLSGTSPERSDSTDPVDPAAVSISGAPGDVLLDGWGAEDGYHLQVASGGSGYSWREVAVLRPGRMDAPSWVGYQCLSGDGRFAAVTVLPSSVVNVASARDRGAFAYSVELASGRVVPIASGVASVYHSPGCGVDARAAFTVGLGIDSEATEVLLADLATGAVIQATEVAGQVTSAVPTAGGVVAAQGSAVVSVPAEGVPEVLVETPGVPYDLRPAADGGLNLLTSTPGDPDATAHHLVNGELAELAAGRRTDLHLFQGRAGRATVSGATDVDESLEQHGIRSVDARKLTAGAATASLDGDALLGSPTSGSGVEPVLLSTRSNVVVSTERAESSAPVVDAAADFIPPGALSGPSVSPEGQVEPRGQAAPTPSSAPPAAGSADGAVPTNPMPVPPAAADPTQTAPGSAEDRPAPATTGPTGPTSASPSAPRLTGIRPVAEAQQAVASSAVAAAQTPVCAADRLAPNRQVMQPSPAQANWAAQMAMQGLLTGSAYTRPAGFANLGLAAYAPNNDFPRLVLQRPSGESWSTVPRSVYLAIMAQESNFSQASWHAPRGMAGGPLVSDYYGAAGDIVSINYANADCGYGIGQVTTGMRIGQRTFSVNGQTKVAVDYQENIAAGLQILQSTWNQLYTAGIIANDGSPRYLENWYFAIWAYNSGIQPNGSYNSTGCTPGPTCTGADGTWGLGWANNPANPNYPPNRLPYLQATYADAAHPGNWAYQERVLGWMASPIIRYGERAYSKPTYRAGNNWVRLPAANTFCTMADNKCDPAVANPNVADAGHCQLNSYMCWWHAPVTWVKDCPATCTTSAFEVSGGSEPANKTPNPPSCTVDRSKVPGNAIVVDDQNGQNLNLQGCGSASLTTGGSFSYAYGTNAAGDPIGAIDTHQLGSGLGGHILFSHTETGANRDLINTGTWTPALPGLQYYKVKIHIPALGAQATNVVYTVNPGGGVAPWKIRVNQRWNSEEWVTIGTFAMQNGGNVVLTNESATVNATGKNYADFDVAWDAVAFVPMGGTPGSPIGGPPGITDAPRGSNPAWVQCGCVRRTAGDPVDTSNGVFSESFTDLSTPGRGPSLAFGRSYSAATADPNGPNRALAADGPFGYGWVHSYQASAVTDPTTGAVTIVQEDGSQVGFTVAGSGYVTSAPRFDAALSRSGSTYTYTRRGEQIFTFDVGSGRLTGIQDLAGARATTPYRTTLAYDSSGRLATITDPAGRSYTITWSGPHITKLQDAVGRTVTYTYDAAGNLTDVYGVGTDRSGPEPGQQDHAHFDYDAAHLMTSMRLPQNADDPASAVTTNVYDGAQRVVRQTDPLGRTTSFAYGPASGLTAGQTLVTDPAGNRTLYSYANGLLVSETKGYGTSAAGTWSYSYDPVTLGVTVAVDPTGGTTTYTYDDHGNRTSSSDALGFTTNYAYNDSGDLLQTVDPNGVTTVNLYDQAGHIATGAGGTNDGTVRYGNVTSSTTTQVDNVVESSTGNFGTAPSRTTQYYYDDPAHPGDRTRLVDVLGNTTTTEYDTYGYVTATTDPLGRKTLQGWNSGRGWLVSTVTPRGTAAATNTSCTPPAVGCTTFRHDAWGNTVLSTDALGHSVSATYDVAGHQTSSTDAKGNKTSFTHDAGGQLVTTTRADGSTLTTTYNADGSTAATTDAGGGTSRYEYDSRGRQTRMTDPSGRAEGTSYDAADRVTAISDASGTTQRMSYDAAGHVTSVDYSDPGTPDVRAIGYDPAGRRVSRLDGTGSSAWSYDIYGAVVTASTGAGAVVQYGYDDGGRATSLTYPDGSVVSYGFDKAGQMTSAKDAAGRQTTFGYNADGDLTTTAFPNGTAVTAAFDDAGQQADTRLLRGTTTVGTLAYERDQNGQLTATRASGALPGGNRAFSYTPLNQVAGVSTGSTPSPFGYNVAGDMTVNGGAGQQYDAAGRLCWTAPTASTPAPACATPPAGATRYAYDGNGRQTGVQPPSGQATVYGYDQADRLVTANGPSGTATYTYDGDGLRASKTVGGRQQQFTWSATAELELLLTDGTASYVYGPGGLPIEQIKGTVVSWFVHDQLGSTVALTDAQGVVSCTYAYDAFGRVTAKTGTAETTLQYGGGYTDSETGLIYLRARYYEPTTGSFLTVDPLVSLTVSPYRYVENNPLNLWDPSGLCAWQTGLGAMLRCGAQAVGGWVKENTVGLCLGGSGSLGNHVGISGCAGFSGGHFFLSAGPSGGLTTGIGGSAGLSLLLSNAHHPDELKGGNPSVGVGVDLRPPLVASAEYQWSRTPAGRYVWQLQCGIGAGFWNMEGTLPMEIHSGYSTSKVWMPFG